MPTGNYHHLTILPSVNASPLSFLALAAQQASTIWERQRLLTDVFTPLRIVLQRLQILNFINVCVNAIPIIGPLVSKTVQVVTWPLRRVISPVVGLFLKDKKLFKEMLGHTTYLTESVFPTYRLILQVVSLIRVYISVLVIVNYLYFNWNQSAKDRVIISAVSLLPNRIVFVFPYLPFKPSFYLRINFNKFNLCFCILFVVSAMYGLELTTIVLFLAAKGNKITDILAFLSSPELKQLFIETSVALAQEVDTL